MNDTTHAQGPHPGWVATTALVLSVAAVGLAPLVTGSPGYVNPLDAAPDTVSDLAHQRREALMSTGFLTMGSAMPLAVCAATWTAGLRRRGVRVPGPYIALAGGLAATSSLLAGGAHSWVLGQVTPASGASSAGVATALVWLAFLSGGVGFTLPFGLLIAGVAVPGLRLRLLPPAVAWVGIVIALISEVTWLALLWPGLTALLPISRFGGLAWLVTAGFTSSKET